MKKFVLTVFACVLLVFSSASAEIFEDGSGFSYFNSYNYLVYDAGSQIISAYDLSSIHIVANNSSRFEFNVMAIDFSGRDGSVDSKHVVNFREDYATGNIYENGSLLDDYVFDGKTHLEIYYKMKSAA